jgi:hypothetical protein
MNSVTLQTFHTFDSPLVRVWQLLADFGAIDRWWPTDGSLVIARVEVEGQGIGMVRHIYNRGAAHAVMERLDRLDATERILQLSILGRDPGRTAWYQATGQLLELEEGRCRLDYQSCFTARRGKENQTRDSIFAAYREMFRGLQAAASVPIIEP